MSYSRRKAQPRKVKSLTRKVEDFPLIKAAQPQETVISAHDRRRLHHRAALFAGSQIFIAVEFFEDALELRRDVFKLEIFLVELLVAVLAEP